MSKRDCRNLDLLDSPFPYFSFLCKQPQVFPAESWQQHRFQLSGSGLAGCSARRILRSADSSSCPGAEACPTVPKVTQEPNTCPQTRLTAPRDPMDMVITGAFSSSDA